VVGTAGADESRSGIEAAREPMALDRFRGAVSLVVPHDCEYLNDTVAMMVERMFSGAPGLRVPVPSQRPLGLDGEAVVGLTPPVRNLWARLS
jgi:predicted ATPase